MSEAPAPFRTALVTGAARRIGAAIATDLAAHGFAVAIHHWRSQDEADALAGRITTAGGRAMTVRANLRDGDETAGLIEAVRQRLGPVDLLVNNASLFAADDARRHEPDKWEGHFAIHARAPAQLAGLFAAQAELAAGLIVNIVDQRVWRLNPNYFSYTLSKSVLWTQTQTLAQALAPKVRVNAIGPGPTVKSERQSEADFAAQIAGLPLRRGPRLAEFGATIRYFFETPSLTGQMIALDGGQHLAWETPDIAGIPE
ncbi:MAG: short chain dehydrogenase [Alphaproteobacteria bacterium]|nr:MAG: short chain dehydrogenase [Alphaproteobacteria bacterium]